MDDISKGLQAAGEAVKAAPDWLDRMLGTLDKYNLLPMSDFRKKNLLRKMDIERQLDEQKKAHTRAMEMADAQMRARIALLEGSPQLALDAAQKRIEEGIPFQQAFQECVPFAMRATKNLYIETIENEYAKERIALYALKESAEYPELSGDVGCTSNTWEARFWDYAKGIRDEDVMRQWGKVLAGEVYAPGRFSLQSLDVLRVMGKNEAEFFKIISPLIWNENCILATIFVKKCNFSGFSALRSIGILDQMEFLMPVENIANLHNKHFKLEYEIIHKRDTFDKIPVLYLTKAGSELYTLFNITEKDSQKGFEISLGDVLRQDVIIRKVAL